MNKRIKELALQAADEIADLFSPGFFDDRMVYDVAEINKKFAELIVRECAVELMKLGNSYSECDTDADYMQGLLDGADIIKEHFGIDSESEIELRYSQLRMDYGS
jgi:hypothetical protein